MRFGVWGLGFGVWGLGFGVGGWGLGVWGLGFGVWGLRFGAWVLGFWVFKFKVQARVLVCAWDLRYGLAPAEVGLGAWRLRGALGFRVLRFRVASNTLLPAHTQPEYDSSTKSFTPDTVIPTPCLAPKPVRVLCCGSFFVACAGGVGGGGGGGRGVRGFCCGRKGPVAHLLTRQPCTP